MTNSGYTCSNVPSKNWLFSSLAAHYYVIKARPSFIASKQSKNVGANILRYVFTGMFINRLTETFISDGKRL